MAEYSGSTWKVDYGEITDRTQFRVGYIDSTSWEAYFPVGQLADLIAVLTGVEALDVGILQTGTDLQARKVSDGFHIKIRVEPRSDTFPPEIMRYYASTNADLIDVLESFQADAGATPEDWDFSQKIDLTQLFIPSDRSKDLPFYGVVFPEAHGAKGDGLADDSVAIQTAIDSLQDGYTLKFQGGKVYRHTQTLIVPSTLTNITFDFQGAVLQHAGLGPSLANKTMDGSSGYGSGGNEWTFRNGTVRGDYGNGYGCIFNLHHVTDVIFEDMVFVEGMYNGGHYLDLLGCLDVLVRRSYFYGMLPTEGGEDIEAIQLDHSTYAGSSAKTVEETSAYDGLPTRRVRVEQCRFLPLKVGGTWYPTPNPIGNHRSALTTDDGFVQEVWFDDNYIYGWHPSPSAGSSMRGWLHFLGARDIHIRRNVFEFWAPAEALSTIEHEAILFLQATTSVITEETVGEVSPTTTAYVRDNRDVTFSDNVLLVFSNHPAPATGYVVQVSGSATGIRVERNTGDDVPLHGLHGASLSRSFFCFNKLSIRGDKRGVSWSGGDSNHVIGNDLVFDASSPGIGIQSRSGIGHIISGNTIWQGSVAIDIWGPTGYSQITNNRAEDYMTCGIKIANDNGGDPQVGDTLVAMNVLKTDLGVSHNSILIGTRGNRIRRFGNQCRNGGTLTDNGSGSITAATDQTS